MLSRFLGVYHHFSKGPDGTVQMCREGKKYLQAIVSKYMKEIGVKTLAHAPSPSLREKAR